MRSSPLTAALAASTLLLLAGCRPDTLWAPDGKSLAVTAPGGLYRFDLATEKFQPLVRGPQQAINPAWSPDGKRLCYVLASVQRGKVSAASLAVMDLATRKQTVLVPKLGLPDAKSAQPGANPALLLKQVFTASWSPDGKRIAYVTHQAGRSVLAVVPAAGGASKQLTSPPNEALSPAWSPTGTEIAYLVEERGKSGPAGIPAPHGPITVHSIRPDGKGHRLLWNPPDGLGLNPVPLGPQWAKDGKTMAVVAEKIPSDAGPAGGPGPNPGVASEVWMIRREGGGLKVVDVPGAAIGTSLSADLQSVVFYQPSGEQPPKRLHLAVITVNSREPKILTSFDTSMPPPEGGSPDDLGVPPIPMLSPDGSRVALLDTLTPGPRRLMIAALAEKEPHWYPLPRGK